ncbi:MAG: ABC transporter permease, partial [Desulfobacterales bacterium]|nr:ABC transporter permease [Desulfobacterales bacterium]
GSLLGGAIIFVINISKITFNFGRQKGLILSTSVNPNDLLLISVIVIIVSVLASLQPAFKASRMNPVQALRHV